MNLLVLDRMLETRLGMLDLQDNWTDLCATATRVVEEGKTRGEQKDAHSGKGLYRGQLRTCSVRKKMTYS